MADLVPRVKYVSPWFLSLLIVSIIGLSTGCSLDRNEKVVIDQPNNDATDTTDTETDTETKTDTSGRISSLFGLAYDSFEDGWGNFVNTSGEVSVTETYSHSGTASVQLKDSSNAALMLRDAVDVTGFQLLIVDFWYFTESLEDGQGFLLQLYDGSQWQTIKRLEKGVNFGNKTFTRDSTTIKTSDYTFSGDMRIRFLSDTQSGASEIYLDDIRLSADTAGDTTGPTGDDSGISTFDHADITAGCSACHNGVKAEGKSEFHIESADTCETCHTPEGKWAADLLNGGFDHTGTTNGCSGCHNGSVATGKSDSHIPSSNSCENCHTYDTDWKFQPADVANFNHSGITASCFTCHNGELATGKITNHVPSGNDCESCHNPEDGWAAGVFSHTNITSGCIACHNGTTATGKSEFHIPSGDSCEDCHSPDTGWTVQISASFDHEGVTESCVACHNGKIANYKNEDHIESSDVCEDCHTTDSWKLGGGDGDGDNDDGDDNDDNDNGDNDDDDGDNDNGDNDDGGDDDGGDDSPGFNHAGITSGCSNCHNGVIAPGKDADHILSSDNCEECHNTTSFEL
ncbi:MAG: hypothetical protein P8Y45_02685 [Exilibacterium sp.]